MAMPKNHNQRDFLSYAELPDGTVARKVHDPLGASGSILAGVAYDSMQASYPSSTTEVYTYYLDGAVVSTVTVSYSSASKHEILSIVRV